jgi:hypothetical protein
MSVLPLVIAIGVANAETAVGSTWVLKGILSHAKKIL